MRHIFNVTIDTESNISQELLLSLIKADIERQIDNTTATVVSIPDHTQKDEVKKTQRGFGKIILKDRYGHEYSIQDSSLATEAAIWFGIEEATPQICQGGWKPVPFPEKTLFSTRMHLTARDVRKILPLLKRFLKYGCVRN